MENNSFCYFSDIDSQLGKEVFEKRKRRERRGNRERKTERGFVRSADHTYFAIETWNEMFTVNIIPPEIAEENSC